VNQPAPATASLAAFSTGTRVAGSVIMLGYLFGLVPGPVVAVVGGLALTTFGRSLALPLHSSIRIAAALAVIAGAVGVGALRWGSLDLAEIRGVQSVLGPTLMVGPQAAAIACGLSVGGALLALGAWLLEPRALTRATFAWGLMEGAIVALALVTVFFDPARSALQSAGVGTVALELGRWTGVTLITVGIAGGLSLVLRRFQGRWVWMALAAAGTVVAGGATAIAGLVAGGQV
jgi:hypothetical protein